jgi:protease IV
MKTSRVLTEILRHEWMMDLRAVSGFLPVVANWLKGNEVMFEEKRPLQIKAAMAATFTPEDVDSLTDVPENTMAIIPLKGEMLKYDSLSTHGTMSIGGLMKYAAMSKNIAGVVIDVDSPGGSVNAIPPMLEAIGAVRRMKKPVVVHGDLVASAALYASVFADYIIADNELSSEFGSIGVMVQFADFKEFWEKEGVKIHTVYAPESTHKNTEFEEALKNNYEPLQENILSPLAVHFQNAVKQQRGKKLNLAAEGLLNGKMFFGGDAVKVGLADAMGSLYKSVEMAYALAEVKKFKN